MNKFLLNIAVIATVGSIISGCSDDDFTAGPQTGDCYFDLTPEQTLTATEDNGSWDFAIHRSDASSPQTVALKVEDESGLFTVTNSVSFAAGEKDAVVSVSCTPSALDPLTDYYVNISIDPQSANLYSRTELLLTIAPPRWKSIGTGSFTGNLLAAFGLPPMTDAQVTIEKSLIDEGVIRMVDPLSAWSEYLGNPPTHYISFNYSNPDAVYAMKSPLGFALNSSGNLVYGSLYEYFIGAGYSPDTVIGEGYVGKYADGVITIPAENICFGFSTLGTYVGNDDVFTLTLPTE
ncbi:hypothetical protein [uncultured Muribaculum sp.]|uniref:hypothetical protein n=1 Tax=uncultured Muribaculum sp. TaxID=1918613 RepID=UPI0025D36D31|nr:hypothetical protein [uncultured Muribaculum sp.]